MIPLRSSERTYSTPTVTLTLIAINLVIFFYEITLPEWQLNRIIRLYGLAPEYFRPSMLFTSMFLHGGWLHVLGNMWFLWIFGKGIEDLLGHGKFLAFYLVCGIAAGFIHVLANYNSPVPTIGASGAIAGVMGAYLIKFPRASIVTLIFIFIFFTTVDIPAAFLLAYWFLIQFFSGVGSVGDSQISHGDVAWFAHVGGFLAGMVLVKIIPAKQRFPRWY
ncbi:MAG: rhomboid family intramembrane serine protease [Bryobacteraceae bacterium]|jgi:membrane associated rhomboid family serine protease